MNILSAFGYDFKNPQLYTQALTHKSYFNENPNTVSSHNETFEFLGDAVLDLALSALLMKMHPTLDEGDLSKVRASLVNEQFLALVSKDIGLDTHLLLGKGEKQSGGSDKPRLVASAFEALMGALFLDGGYEVAADVIQKIFQSRIESLDLTTLFKHDYKTRIQEKIQKEKKLTPEYELVAEEGPDHDKTFFVDLKVSDQVVARGQGRSKKQAEQDAARLGLEAMI